MAGGWIPAFAGMTVGVDGITASVHPELVAGRTDAGRRIGGFAGVVVNPPFILRQAQDERLPLPPGPLRFVPGLADLGDSPSPNPLPLGEG